MKKYNTLIRLHKRKLDALRRQVGDLEGQKAQLHKSIDSLRAEMKKEMELAGTQPEMANFFGQFAGRIKARQDEIYQEIKELDKKIFELNNQIIAIFQEMKKYEIAKENAIMKQKEKEKRKETIELDEIAAQQFTRKNGEDFL
ncbi:MAG: flagellar FliJ family protein [Rickettsiales bacterium]